MFTRPKFVFSALAVAVLYLASAAPAFSTAFTIDTTPPNTNIATFGYPNTATYGQTITAVAGTTQLDSFTFNIQTGGVITYRAYVMAWNGTNATGPILFQTGDQMATGNQFYTYHTSGINLSAGSQYVLFVSVSNNYFVGNSSGVMAARHDNPYAGGAFVYSNNSGNFGLLSTTPWSSFTSFDLAFVAQFSSPNGPAPVPEPAAIFLLGTGLTGLAGYARRRRNKVRDSMVDEDQ